MDTGSANPTGETPAFRRRPVALSLSVALALAFVGVSLPPDAGAGPRRSLSYKLPLDRLEVFAFEVRTETETRLVERPKDADRFDLSRVEERLATVRTHSRGRLERSLARVFRDQSLGLIARVVRLEGSVARGDGEPTKLDLGSLEGKSVALRLHASGELLDSYGWQHIEGAGRPATVLGDLFLQSILRLPPHPPRGRDPVGVSYRSRVQIDGSLSRDRTWTLAFTRAEAPSDCGRRCIALRYSGEAVERSRDTHPSRPAELSGKGTITGEIVLRGRRGALWSHRWTSRWTTETTSRGPGGERRGKVVQELVEEGSLFLAPEGASGSAAAASGGAQEDPRP